MKPKILIMNHGPDAATALKNAFGDCCIDFLQNPAGASPIGCIRSEHPNIVFLEMGGSHKDALELLKEAKSADPSLTVIMTADSDCTREVIEMMKEGAYDILVKPFDPAALRKAVAEGLENNLDMKKIRISDSFPDDPEETLDEDYMIGSTQEMMAIWKMVGKVAESDAAVLITGESGTGKELLARAIHGSSRRRNRHFHVINCAAIPENLLESELFGHEKGAFTNAHCRKIGKFEQCDKGTLFLDEIGEMSLVNQSKLLRVLEMQEFERVGGNETIRVDLRFIAASNRCLHEEVHNKNFRLDLFSRLRVISFHIPPLRERKADIPLLARLFVRKYSRKNNKPVKDIAPQTLDLLLNHSWEGNVRELQNAINSAVVLSSGTLLMPDDFAMLQEEGHSAVPPVTNEDSASYADMFKNIIEPHFEEICRKSSGNLHEQIYSGLEMALLRLALERCNQNQVLASKILGISRNTLRSRIERFGLNCR